MSVYGYLRIGCFGVCVVIVYASVLLLCYMLPVRLMLLCGCLCPCYFIVLLLCDMCIGFIVFMRPDLAL